MRSKDSRPKAQAPGNSAFGLFVWRMGSYHSQSRCNTFVQCVPPPLMLQHDLVEDRALHSGILVTARAARVCPAERGSRRCAPTGGRSRAPHGTWREDSTALRGRRQRGRGLATAHRPRPSAQPLACCASAPSGRPGRWRGQPKHGPTSSATSLVSSPCSPSRPGAQPLLAPAVPSQVRPVFPSSCG
jgi:hypothetical protein